MLEDRPNEYLKKYINNAAKITIHDQNGKFLFEGYGDAMKTPDSIILDGEFGKYEVKNLNMISYELKSSAEFDFGNGSNLELNINAYLEKLPPAYGEFSESFEFPLAPPNWQPDSVFQSYPVMLTITLTPEQVLEVLQDAKTLLIEQGWTQGSFYNTTPDESTTYCVLGALGKIMMDKFGLEHWSQTNETQPAGIIQEILNHDIAHWNDMPETTFSDVMDVFDKAILAAKEKVAER